MWPERGWYGDKDDPSSVVYWDGEAWGNRAPKPAEAPKPEPVWKRARPVALGILVAVAACWAVWTMTAPSELDCSLAELDAGIARAQGEIPDAKPWRCP